MRSFLGCSYPLLQGVSKSICNKKIDFLDMYLILVLACKSSQYPNRNWVNGGEGWL
jgi:hypothetical protein